MEVGVMNTSDYKTRCGTLCRAVERWLISGINYQNVSQMNGGNVCDHEMIRVAQSNCLGIKLTCSPVKA